MKIFDSNESWCPKVNFVDNNNVFVGYNMGQSCCENAGWFISDTEEEKIYDEKFNSVSRQEYKEDGLAGYTFDTKYFKEIDNGSQFDSGGMVRFRLTATNKPTLYLHLYNCHNGYYGHGFESKIGDQKWKEGTL